MHNKEVYAPYTRNRENAEETRMANYAKRYFSNKFPRNMKKYIDLFLRD